MIINFFSNASKSLFAKILFTAIILSFGLWGIGDIIRHYISSRTVISVGDVKISSERFRTEFTKYKQNIRNTISSEEEIKNINIKEILINSLIEQAVEDMTLQNLQILVSKQSVAKTVYSLPEFQTDNVFDERLYTMFLQQSGITETMLIQQLKNSIARNQLYHPIIAGYKVPNFVKNLLGTVYEANKTIYISKLNINDIKLNKKIPENELKEYFNNNADKYKRPELKDISILKIDYTKFVNELNISDKEIAEYYRDNKDLFKVYETRDINRIEFDSKEEAEIVFNKVNRGGKLNKNIKSQMKIFKNMKKSEFPEKVGEEIFKLKKGKVSLVYPIGGKFYIYQVSNINLPPKKSEQQIKQEVKIFLQNNKINSPEFQSEIKNIRNKIDDDISMGKSIKEIAKNFKLEITEIKDFDINKSNINELINDENTCKEILKSITTLQENQVSAIIDESDTISYIVFVNKITKSTIPQFNDIKNKIRSDFTFEKKNKALLDNLSDLLENKEKALKDIKKNSKKFTISKKDIIMKLENEDLKRILEIIPNYDYIMDILYTLHSNDIKYYRISQNEYVLVAVDKVEFPQYSSNTMNFFVNKIFQNTLANDIVHIAKKEFKNRQKIKTYNKTLDKIIKSLNNNDI